MITFFLIAAVVLFVVEAISAASRTTIASRIKFGWLGLAFFAMAHLTI